MNQNQLEQLKGCNVKNLKDKKLFKYVLSDPTDNYYVLKEVIEAFTGVKVETVEIQNPVMDAHSFDDGEPLEVHGQDKDGKEYIFVFDNLCK